MAFNPWHVEPNGTLAAKHGRWRLVVRIVSGWARYLVLRHPSRTEACPPVLVASGTERNQQAAMAAAERTAGRLIGAAQPTRHRSRRGQAEKQA
jgi:hypothetical protein